MRHRYSFASCEVRRDFNGKLKTWNMDINLSPLFKDLIQHCKSKEQATEDLRQALNEIISKHGLHPSVVLSLLARLSAAYIRLTQNFYDSKNAKEVVEQDFLNMLNAHLTSLEEKELIDDPNWMREKEAN